MFLSNKLNMGAGTPAPTIDAQFNNVTMLLHGDGTNGAQNNTFLDSSTNNFAITRNGNTTQGSFSPYGSNWSNFFDGSGDWLSTASTSALAFGTGDFTLEAWVYPLVNQTGFRGILSAYDGAGPVIETSGNYWAYYFVSSGVATSTLVVPNTWTHVALTRSGTTGRMFVNGVLAATVTDSTNYSTNSTVTVGTLGGGLDAGYEFNGYISNARIVKGTAVYTSDFTPPTAPLTAISGTSFLGCANNRFVDDSASPLTITVNGNPSVQRFNPFGTSTAYSTSVIGGSGYFDGSDSLSLLANSAFDYGTGDYTIEGWVYSSTTTWSLYATGGGGSSDQFCCDGGNLYWGYGINLFGSGTGIPNFFTDQNINQWVHIAMCRSSGTTRAFKNGVVMATSTVTSAIGTPTNQPFIAVRTDGSYPLNGYMGGLRIVKGSAVYTSAFTPPTAPLTAVSGTSLLLNYTNGAIFDNAMMNDLETVGNAQISTSVKKYGTGSIYFDGTGDGLFTKTTQTLAFGTGDFTVEFWLYLAANLNAFANVIQMGTTAAFTIEAQATVNVLNLTDYESTVYFASNTALTTGTWIHVAATRASGTLRLFQNGIQVGSAANTANLTNTGTGVYIGKGSDASSEINGYIDDLRITKGYARYTANFTPPTAAFPNTGPY